MQSAMAAEGGGEHQFGLKGTERAAELREGQGRPRLVAVSNGLRGRILSRLGRGEEARSLLTAAVTALSEEPGPDTVEVMTYLAAVYSMTGRADSSDVTQEALELAQRLGAEDSVLATLFNSRGIALGVRGRRHEAVAHFREALRLARASGASIHELNPTGNIGDAIMCDDPRGGLEYALRGQDLARQIGARYVLGVSVLNTVLCLLRVGEWDRAAAAVDTAIEDDGLGDFTDVARASAVVRALRGDPSRAREELPAHEGTEEDPQEAAYHAYALAVVCDAEGDVPATLHHARRAAAILPAPTMDPFVVAWPLAVRAAHELDDRAALDEVLAMLDGRYDGEIPVMVRAERRLAVARLVADPAERVAGIEDAVTDLRAVGSPYHLALALLDLAQAQRAAGKDPADVVAEAVSIATVLGCPSVVERADRLP